MTPGEPQLATRTGRDHATPRSPESSALRRSGAIRAAISLLLAGGITAVVIVALWKPLNAKSDVMGYPIFGDFNPNNYAHAYYLTVAFFPILALLLFVGLTWIGPRVGLVAPPSRGRLRPLVRPAEAEPSPDSASSAQINARVAAGGRIAAVGAVLGLEVGIASSRLWPTLALVTIGYSLVVVLGSLAVSRLRSPTSAWKAWLPTVNALGAPLTIVALSFISAQTAVRVLSNGSVHHYPWFPFWLGVPFAALLFAWILVCLRRVGLAGAAVVERRAVLLIAAPVALFVLVARLPGDSGPLSLYEVGQLLSDTRLVLHGWLPWRDLVLPHGLLRDVFSTAVGWGVFGDNYWGSQAGFFVIMLPIAVVTTYLLFVYLVGRNWPLLLAGTATFLGTWIGGGAADPRFILWPLVLLLLAALLQRCTRTRAIALGILTVVQAIVTPEMAAAVAIIALVVVAYEWYWQPPGEPVRQAFRRTLWFAVGTVGFALAFAIYMAARGALGDLISVTIELLAGHFGLGIPPTPGAAPAPEYDVIALAPVVSLLISFTYAVVMLRLRRPFRLADWPMAVVALYVFFYYTKFLTRMDGGHALQPFIVAMPLMIYIVYRVVAATELWIRTRASKRHVGWLPAHPVGVALLICFGVFFWGPVHTTVRAAPSDYRPTAPDPPIPHVGYAADYQPTVVNDLRRIVNAYLGPHDRLMDITDEPGIFYYWLGRGMSSPWGVPGGGLVDTTKLQHLLIDDLRRERPKLIVFDNVADPSKMFGLAALDGMPNPVTFYLVSKWILHHYRPLLVSHGRTIYALPSVRPIPAARLHLTQPPVTRGVRFLGQACLWGDSPTFLDGPAQPQSGATSVPVRVLSRTGPEVTLTGWAGDARTGRPAREVIATLNGRIVGHTKPSIDRPDVVRAGNPRGFLRSGYQFSVPVSAITEGQLRVFAVGQDGSVTELPAADQPNLTGQTTIAGRSVTLQPKANPGSVDTAVQSTGYVKIAPPAGSSWANYPWFELQAPGNTGFVTGQFWLSDVPGTPTAANDGHLIAFNTLTRSPHRYIIPAASCQQWQGYGSRPLYLSPPAGQLPAEVRLVR